MLIRLLANTLLLIFITQLALATERYDQVRIWSENTSAIIPEILAFGIDPEGLGIRQNVYVDVIVNQREHQLLLRSGIALETLISDMSAFYESRLNQNFNREFGYGSMGGYYTYSEIIENMDLMHTQYPGLVSIKDSIGTSLEGRTIWAFKISDNPEIDEDEAEVFLNSLTHAREPAAMMTLMYFAWQLVENYNTDQILSYLVNEREIWFVPVVNPDGYVFNESTNPNGGGMHRKNRRPGCTNSPGVDLNRNWGYQWGYDNIGSSGDNCSNTYRGTSPFSEPETQAIRDFVLGYEFQTVFNYHSYGNLLLRPFSYDPNLEIPAPDADIYMELGQDLIADNSYHFGTGWETLNYLMNGDVIDYMYGELGIINFIPEVGTSAQGGFWPPTEMIYPIAEDNLSMNIHLAGVAGSWVRLENFELLLTGPLENGEIVSCELLVKNKGLTTENSMVTLNLMSPDNSLLPLSGSYDLSNLNPQESIDLGMEGLVFEVQAGAGTTAELIISIDIDGQYSVADTFSWSLGGPDTLFSDDLEEGFGNWFTTDDWDVNGDAYESDLAMTDSPFGDYPPLSTMEVTLINPVDQRGYGNLILSFNAKWDIELDYDFCQVVASADEGATWTALAGNYTVIGNGATVQPLGEPGYSGLQNWVYDELDLTPFAGAPSLILGFRILSDTYYEGDGFTVDNLLIQGWGIGFHLGDLSRDGQIDISDAILLADWIIEGNNLEGEAQELSDLNLDSSVDVVDLVLLIEAVITL